MDIFGAQLAEMRKQDEQKKQDDQRAAQKPQPSGKKGNGDPYSNQLAAFRNEQKTQKQPLTAADALADIAGRVTRAAADKKGTDLNKQRSSLMNQLQTVQDSAAYITDPDAANANKAEERRIINQLNVLDRAQGNADRYYSNADRAAGALAGSVLGQGAAYANTAGTVASMAGAQDETGRAIADSAYSGYATDPLAIENMRKAVEQGGAQESLGILEQNEKFAERAFNTADRLDEKASGYMAKAKEGASKADRLMVDLTQGAVDLASDALANAILPGSGKLMLGLRSFGNESMQRRHAGADINEQIVAGGKSAAIELFTEAISGPFEKVYGKTLLGKKTAQLVEKLGKNPSTRRLLTLTFSGLGESFEEYLSDVLNPAADRLLNIYRGDYGNGVKGYWKEIWSKDFIDGALYDAALGGLLGIAGGAVDVARKGGDIKSPKAKEAITQAGAEAAQAAIDQAVEKKAAEAPEAALEQGAPQAPQKDAGEPAPQGGTEIAPTPAEAPTAAPAELNSQERADGAATPAEAEQTESPNERSQGESAEQNRKEAQFQLIQQNHPNTSSTEYTWIDSADDIKTFDEAFAGQQGNVTPDFTAEMIEEARRTGKITVYSSHRFLTRPGTFVTPSKMLAQDYAGDGKVYAKTVDVNDIAWIDEEQGQYAKVAPVQQTQTEERAAEDVGPYEGKPSAEQPAEETLSPEDQQAADERYNEPGEQYGAIEEGENAARESAGSAETEAADQQTPAEEQPSNRIPYESRGRRGGEAQGSYEELGERYGTIEPGENPARESAVPKQIDDQRKVGEAVRTAYEASATPEERLADIRNAVVDGKLSYISVSNESLAKEAESRIRKDGWEASLRDFLADVRSGKTGDRLTAIGAVLYNNAANSGMDGKSLVDLVVAYNDLMHNMGRGLAAGRILKTLTPEAKLYAIQKTVSRMNEEAAEKRAKKEAKEQKKREKQASRKGNTEPKPKYADKRGNIPVSMWAERAGETVADSMAKKLEEAGLTKPMKVKTVAQQAEADIKKVLKSYSETKSMNINAEALENILNNPRFALDLYESLRNSLEQKSGLTREEIDSLGMDWINEPLADVLGQMAAKDKNIHIDEKLADEFLKAKTDEERDEILGRIKQNIADQVPSTLRDKWNALRYLNMLGNFKTQARNLAGNATMVTTASLIKNHLIRGSIEGAANALSGGRFEKNTSILYNPKLAAEAWADFKNVEQEALGERKYSDAGKQAEGFIQDNRTIFKNNGTWGTAEAENPLLAGAAMRGVRKVADAAMAGMEGYRKATNWAMEMGDQVFSRSVYADSMAGWMQAHKVKHISDMTPEMLDRARAFAIKEAQEATFRDTNGLSDWASRLGRSGNEKGFGKFMGLVGEGIMPFRKTPANVLMRAYEYSPLGVFNVIGQSIQSAKGNATGSDVVNALSKTFTGTGLAFVGYMLARAGKLRTKDDDDKLEQFRKDRGEQDYALDIGDGKNITLDWVAPDSIPLFMGAELEKIVRQGGISGDDALEILSQLTEPMLEMSMLSGLNDALELSNSYDNTVGALPNLVLNSILGYATQGLNNSLIRQGEQASEKVRRTSYTDPNSPLPSSVQRKISQYFGGIPGNDIQQQDYIDVWGRKQEQGSTGERILQSFINPAYVGKDRSTKYDGELERLYNAGFTAALPKKPARSTDIDNQRLTPEEYELYATTAGQKKLELIGDFLDSEEYKKLGDEERSEIIGNLYEYANYQAKKAVMAERGGKLKDSSWDKVASVEKTGVDVAGYLLGKKNANEDGEGSLKAQEIYDWLTGSGYNEKQKAAIWDANKGQSDKTWNQYYNSNPVTILANYGLAGKEARDAIDRLGFDSGSVKTVEKMGKAYNSGISPDKWGDAYEQHKVIDNDDSIKLGQKAETFARYLEELGLTKAQQNILRGQMKFYSSIAANTEKFDALSGVVGMTRADRLTDDMSGLTKQNDKLNTINSLKYLTDEEKWKTLEYFGISDACLKKAMDAKAKGWTFDQWVQSYTKGK